MNRFFTLIAAALVSLSMQAQTASTTTWTFSKDKGWAETEYETKTTITDKGAPTARDFTIYAGANSLVKIQPEEKATIEGKEYVGHLQLTGKPSDYKDNNGLSPITDEDGEPTDRAISFQVKFRCLIQIVVNSSSSSELRELIVAEKAESGRDATILGRFNNINSTTGEEITVNYYGADASEIFIYSSRGGVNIYQITIVPYGVKLGAAGMGTYCAAETTIAPDGLQVYTASYDKATNKVTLSEVTNKIIPANEGAVLVGESYGVYSMQLYTGTITGSDIWTSNGLIGAARRELPDQEKTNYVLITNTDGKGQFVKLKTGEYVPAGKAYLPVDPSASSAKTIDLSFGETTDIKNIAELGDMTAMPRYNLNGQRVSDGHKGIVIVGGKKMVVK